MIYEEKTLVEMPVVPTTPRTDTMRISPMRWQALYSSMRATALSTRIQPLKPAMQRVFMTTTTWFHEHLETPMGPQVASALQRIHDASQGLFADQRVLSVDLYQIYVSSAGKDVSVGNAIVAAEQALGTVTQ